MPFFARAGVTMAERLVARSLAQVTRYFTDDTLREAARATVLDLIGPETVAIIGHSLGSVVAYEALRQLEAPSGRQALPLLLTLGSPLGVRTVIYDRLRPRPPAFPRLVQRWVNLLDANDLVAAELDLVPLFSDGLPPGAIFEPSLVVDNGVKPHDARFYLTKHSAGRSIAQALTGD